MESQKMVSYDEFSQYIRRFRRSNALIKLAVTSCLMEKEGKVFVEEELISRPGILKPKTIVSQCALSYISMVCALSANEYRNSYLEHDDILLLGNWYTNLELPSSTGFETVIRLSQEQLPFQNRIKYEFARGYHLINDVSRREGFSAPLDLEVLFKESSGLSVDEYYWLAWCLLWRIMDLKPAFSKKDFLTHSIRDLKDVITSEKFDLFLNLISADVKTLRQKYESMMGCSPLILKKYGLNILSVYPIIRLPSEARDATAEEFLITNSKLVFNKIATGVYWCLRDYFYHQKGASQDFVNFWGEVFEVYVGDLLGRIFPGEEIYNLNNCVGFSGRKHADWLVSTREAVFIFECKSSLMPMSAKAAWTVTAVEDWLKKNISAGVEQCILTQQILLGGVQLKGGEFIASGRRIYRVVLTYQALYFEKIYLRHAKEHISADILPSEGNDFILSISDLELVEGIRNKVALQSLLEAWVISTGLDNFRTICGHYYEKGRAPSPFLESVAQRFLDKVQS